MTLVLWTIVAALVFAAAALQFVGVRALDSWGVRPSRMVLTLRVFNIVVVASVVAFALWQWAGR